jgi:hypothetical protein
MTIGLLFWILMILWAVFGVVPNFPRGEAKWQPFGGSLLLWILLGLLGWNAFGFIIHQ